MFVMLEKSFGLSFFLKKPKNEKRTDRYIYLRLAVDGVSKDVATKRQWDNLRWNPSAGRTTGSKEDAKAFNSYLDVMFSKVHHHAAKGYFFNRSGGGILLSFIQPK